MDGLPEHRTPGEYTARYAFPTDPFERPPAEVISRIAHALHHLDDREPPAGGTETHR